ncbi:MAG: hypothetical protein U9N44_04680 [Chloroflexota bacterium]|nr:hypothetical protein [Chloroflexota bacterium]
MSKLLDKLEKTSKGNSRSIGFVSTAAGSKAANMVIIVSIDKGDAAAAGAAKEYADALLLSDRADAGRISTGKTQLPWGAAAAETNAGQISKMKEGGCDFIVIDAESSPPSILQAEKLARIIEIDPSMPDGPIRAVSQLPIDVILIGGEADASIKRLIACQHVSNLTSKHLLARSPLDVSPEYVRELWETGVAGVVVRVTGDTKDALAGLRQAADALPTSRRKKTGKAGASLPFAAFSEVQDEEPEEDE